MRRLLLLSAVFAFSALSVWAQVPDSISQNFNRQYPGIKNPTWNLDENRYRVTYRDSLDRERSILYDREGQIYSQYSEVQTNDVPASVSDYYKKNYPGETKYKVYRETDNMGVNSYYIDRKGERIYFDNQGTFNRKGSITSMPKSGGKTKGSGN